MNDCRQAIADDSLLDWWTGDAGPSESRRIEKHLLGCGPCSDRLALLQGIADGVGTLMREGDLPVVVAPAVLDRLRREGCRIREYTVAPGSGVQCTVSPDDDVLLARLQADLSGVSQLDLVWRVDEATADRLSELPFDPRAGELLVIPPLALIRQLPAHVARLELLSLGPAGERSIGRYEFRHTPWPGPGSA